MTVANMLRQPVRLFTMAATATTSPSFLRFSSLSGSLLANQPKTSAAPTLMRLGAQPSAGLKWVASPHKRCQHCYFEVIDETLYVFCTAHPRHKQGQKKVATKFSRTLTHATTGSAARGGKGSIYMNTQQSFRTNF